MSVAQVRTYTPGSVSIGDTFTLTCNGKDITYTAAAATVADVTAGLKDLVDATTIPEFLEVAAADVTTAITLTARTAGMPFTITSSSVGGTLSAASTTASSGPNHYDIATNWSLGTVPGATDDVVLTRSSVDIKWGLPAAAVTVNSWTRKEDYTGQIGLPDTNTNGYYEYREKWLALNPTTMTLGYVKGGGPNLEKYNFDGNAVTIHINSTGTPIGGQPAALLLKGSIATTTINILQGNIYLAPDSGNTMVATVKVGHEGNPANDVILNIGSGAVVSGAAFQQYGGDVVTAANLGTATVIAGSLTVTGSSTITTLTLLRDGASGISSTLLHLSSGTITTCTVDLGCVLDNSMDPRTKTITTINVYAGATILDPSKLITFTNGIGFPHSNPFTDHAGMNLGSNWTLTRT